MTKVDQLIEKFKEFKEELNKGVNMSYGKIPNATTGTSGGEGGMYRSEDMDKNVVPPMTMQLSEDMDKVGASPGGGQDIVAMAEDSKQANPHMGHSVFHMHHVNEIVGMKDHGTAKKKAHELVDASTANAQNKAKLKNMINSSRNPAHLAQGMSNHILAHPSEGLKVAKGEWKKSTQESEETLEFQKNGQWNLHKSKFKTLQHKIEAQGHSPESAAAITASIGRKELGQKEMTARSKAAMNKVDPEENINIPHPQRKAKMANGVNKGDELSPKEKKEGTNKRLADPEEEPMEDPRGRVRMVKDEGTNEKANPSHPHNKGKFKVMDEVEEKSSGREDVKGLPYNGKDKDMHKGEHGKPVQGNEVRGNDENKAPGRGTLSV